MKLPRLSLKSGLWACLAVVLVGLSMPFLYDKYGSGAKLVRLQVAESDVVRRTCGLPAKLMVMPWGFEIEDSDLKGKLSLTYRLRCAGESDTVDAELVHSGGPWKFQALVLNRAGAKIDLLSPPAR